ncbi:hypothetical protein TWF696_008754 [Orbilia brochopaga]|uniref:4a-hydroxytetrahydrobiopterin dehydratase n=1 Tax=Orbilia brochopaga TaxID=3140254 RepID=A0AAV9UHM2_9PEZI
MHSSLRCGARRLPAALANAPQLATALSRAPAAAAAAAPPAPAPAPTATLPHRIPPLSAPSTKAAFSTSTTSHRYATADYYDEQNPSDPGGDFVYRSRPPREDDGRRPPRNFDSHPMGTTKLQHRQLIPPETAAELYREFKPHKAVITPGPTDPPGYEPQEVNILWRESSPPERMLASLARLCFSPSYRIAKAPGPDTVNSTDLIGMQLAFGTVMLPPEPRPMKRCHKEWKIGRGGVSLEKAFRFSDAGQALRFITGLQYLMKIKIGKRDYLEHHPDLGFSGRRVFVRWGTHEPRLGISSWDIYCAKRTDFWAVRCQVRDVVPETASWTLKCVVPRRQTQNAESSVQKAADATDLAAAAAAAAAGTELLPDTLSPAIHRLVQVKNKLASGEAQGLSVNTLLDVKSDLLKASQDLVRVAEGVAEASDKLVERYRSRGLAALESALQTREQTEAMSEEDLEMEDMEMEEGVEKPGMVLKGEWGGSPRRQRPESTEEHDEEP